MEPKNGDFRVVERVDGSIVVQVCKTTTHAAFRLFRRYDVTEYEWKTCNGHGRPTDENRYVATSVKIYPNASAAIMAMRRFQRGQLVIYPKGQQ